MIRNILDSNFAHHYQSKLSCDEQSDKTFIWNRKIDYSKLTVITDYLLHNSYRYPNKIAWLIEPKTIVPQLYNKIKTEYEDYKFIFTHDKDLLKIDDKFKFIPVGGSWIYKRDQKIYKKSKLLSIIASSKTMTEGHKLRHAVIDKFKSEMDIYGRDINTIKYKLQGLLNYRFQIVIENGNYDYYFTEKLIDCFVTGTIPIYWGCPSIGDFFNKNGILSFSTITDLENIIYTLSTDKYEEMLPYAKENFELAKKYLLSEYHIKKYI